MKTPTMMYKHPGKHKLHGDMFDYIIVPASEIRTELANGWHLTTPAALLASENKVKAAKPPQKKRVGRPRRNK